MFNIGRCASTESSNFPRADCPARRRGHPRHPAHTHVLDQGTAGTSTQGSSCSNPSRQTLAKEAAYGSKLCRIPHSRRVCGGLWLGLCGALPEFAGYLCPASSDPVTITFLIFLLPHFGIFLLTSE